MKIKLSKTHLLLALFIIVSLVYLYAQIKNLPILGFYSKPLIVPIIVFYYLISVKTVNKLFSMALFFAFCGGGSTLFFSFSGFTHMVVIMGFSLLFILINIVIIAEMIGEIKAIKFYKIIIPFVLVLLLLYYISFKGGGHIRWLYYVFGTVVAIYASFSFYLYIEKRTVASLLNLIGVLAFVFSIIAKGLEHIDGGKTIYKIVNIIFYTLHIFFVCQAFIGFANDEKKELEF